MFRRAFALLNGVFARPFGSPVFLSAKYTRPSPRPERNTQSGAKRFGLSPIRLGDMFLRGHLKDVRSGPFVAISPATRLPRDGIR